MIHEGGSGQAAVFRLKQRWDQEHGFGFTARGPYATPKLRCRREHLAASTSLEAITPKATSWKPAPASSSKTAATTAISAIERKRGPASWQGEWRRRQGGCVPWIGGQTRSRVE